LKSEGDTKLQLKNKVAIVTGSGHGIGRAIALRLASVGARVVVADLNIDTARQTAQEIETGGGQAFAQKADVTSQTNVAMLIGKTVETYGSLDILINNAGIYPHAPILDITESDWDHVVAVNLKSTFLCSQAAARHMIEQKNGVIINIASIDAKTRTTGNAHYAAAKAGVISFTRTMACEMADHGIRVNAVAPGWILTDPQKAGTERWLKIAEDIPVHRFGSPEDVAEAVLFLASDSAAYITGEVLDVNGGLFMD
jgi:3-oxoacyl-[acyl-carrier protein] reductase